MRPKPFIPEIFNNDERYVVDKNDKHKWHRCKHRTLYADTDRSGSVYHSNYLRYFEIGRTTLMRDLAYCYREIEDNGYVYPIIEVGLSFYNPLYYDDPMWIHTRPSSIERVKLTFEYIITNELNNKIICKGFTKHCAVNASYVPVEIDKKTMYLWKAFTQDE